MRIILIDGHINILDSDAARDPAKIRQALFQAKQNAMQIKNHPDLNEHEIKVFSVAALKELLKVAQLEGVPSIPIRIEELIRTDPILKYIEVKYLH